jgi:hypothetical protein
MVGRHYEAQRFFITARVNSSTNFSLASNQGLVNSINKNLAEISWTSTFSMVRKITGHQKIQYQISVENSRTLVISVRTENRWKRNLEPSIEHWKYVENKKCVPWRLL